jgi:hypothetical protein
MGFVAGLSDPGGAIEPRRYVTVRRFFNDEPLPVREVPRVLREVLSNLADHRSGGNVRHPS